MSDRRKVVVTGASSGIGYATAQRFAQEGWDVCVTARRESILRDLVGTFPPGDHLICPGDYSDPACAESMGEAIAEKWQRLDALANVAGVYLAAKVVDSPLEEWRQPLDIMINGAVYMTRMAVPWMTDGGRIIHVTSIHGGRAEANASSYAMAKAALNQFCRVLAIELAPRQVLVNATPVGMHPGPDESPVPWEGIRVELAYDLVYTPPSTRFLREAVQTGARALGGIEMFLEQAWLQFAILSGQEAPRSLFEEILAPHRKGLPEGV